MIQIIVAGFIVLLPWNNIFFGIDQENFVTQALGPTMIAGVFVPVFLALSLILIFIRREFTFRITRVDCVVLLASLLIVGHWLFTGLTTTDPFLIVQYLSGISFYALLRLSKLPHRWMLISCILSILLQSGYGLYQYFLPTVSSSFLPVNSITGSFFNSGPFGGFMSLGLVLCVGLLVHVRSYQTKWFFVIIGSTVVAALILSESRAAWIATCSGILYQFWQVHKMNIKNLIGQKSIRAGMALIMIVLIAGLCGIKLYDYKKDSADGRILIWKNTVEMIQDHPWYGVGPGKFSAHYMHYQADNFQFFEDSRNSVLAGETTHAFNEFLHITVESGVIGLLILLYLIFQLIFYPLSSKFSVATTEIWIIRAGILSILIFGLFSYPFSIHAITVFFVGLTGQISCEMKGCPFYLTDRSQINNAHRIKRNLVPLTIVVCLLYYLKFFTSLCAAYQILATTITDIESGTSVNKVEKLTSIYPVLKNNGLYMTTYGRLMVISEHNRDAIPVLMEAGQLLPYSQVFLDLGDCNSQIGRNEQAEQYYLYAHKMIPGRIKPYYKLADLYRKMGRIDSMKSIIHSYLNRNYIKRTMVSYEYELEMKEWLEGQY